MARQPFRPEEKDGLDVRADVDPSEERLVLDDHNAPRVEITGRDPDGPVF